MPRQIGDVILEVEDLSTYCFTRRGVGKAVDGVSFSLREGETSSHVRCGEPARAVRVSGEVRAPEVKAVADLSRSAERSPA